MELIETRILARCLAAFAFVFCCCSPYEPVTFPDIDGQVTVPGRAVWVDLNDSAIMALDFNSGKSPFIVFRGGVDEMSRPVITSNGTWILFGTTKGLIKAVPWNDRSPQAFRTLKKGACPVAVWRDPVTTSEWVYYVKSDSGSSAAYRLYRFLLADPSVDETVWNKTDVDVNFSISQDGAYGAGQFPWPQCGLISMEYLAAGQGGRAVVPNGAFFKSGYIGCNSNVFPDNSYRMFHINGGPMQWNGKDFQNHRGIYMFDNVVNSDTAPYTFIPIDIRGQGVNRVRVTNDPAYVMFCAPMIVEGLSDPRDIYIGRFNDDFTQIAHATNISNSPGIEDVSGYLWLPSGLGIGGPDSVGLFAGDTADTAAPSADSICVTSPAPGSSYRAGDTIRVKWSDPGNLMIGGLVSLSTDNGKSWCLLTTVGAVLKTSPEWGDYPWAVPDTLSCTSTAPVSGQCRIKVSDYNRQNVFGLSGVFSITN